MYSTVKNKHKKYFINQFRKQIITNQIVILVNIILLLTFSLSIKNEQRNIKVFQSEINLIITGSNSNSNVLSNDFAGEPSQILVNGEVNTSCNKMCWLNNGINNVTIRFGAQLESCKNMFKGLTNIIEIDLSIFDTSKVKDMSYMFDNCTNLEKINFGNINTSLVENMKCLFHGLTKIVSFDVANFDTSSVTNIEKLFCHCNSLKTIDVSNFNTSKVENMFDLFAYCYELTSLNISHFDTSKVINMQGMFYRLYNIVSLDVHINTSNAKNMNNMFNDCRKLTSLDVSSFDTSSATLMKYMFYNCSKLKSIDISRFNTSNVENMKQLFAYCYNLTSIDVSNFDTSKVTSMVQMFHHCENLKSLNLSKFNTSKVEDLKDLFAYCFQLTSLDLSNFDISNVKNMRGIFYSLYNLKYLDLSNFNISKVNNTNLLFGDCISLVYINLYSFKIINNSGNFKDTFKNVPEHTKICIKDNYTRDLLLVPNKTDDCSDICFKANIKIDLSQNKCVEYCNETINIFEYNKFCYESCPSGNPILINDIYTCLNEIPENYYLDANDSIYKECYPTCNKCIEKGDLLNHKCLECKSDFRFLNDSLFVNNCYINCSYYYYFNELNQYICTESFECSGKFNKLIIDKKQCIDDCKKDNKYKNEYNGICYIQCPNGTLSSINNKCINYETQEELFKDIINILTKEINIKETKTWNDIIFQKENILYTITKTSDQKNNFISSNNYTYINLGKCENKLKEIYNIPLNDDLYIIKIDVYLEGIKIPKVEYEVYYPLYDDNNLTKLNLSKFQRY